MIKQEHLENLKTIQDLIVENWCHIRNRHTENPTEPFGSYTNHSYTTSMIDISKLTAEEIQKLDEQIQEYKSQRKLSGYKVTFYVRFDPEKHINDMLTFEGTLDGGFFENYILDNVLTMIDNDFNFDGIEEDSGCVCVDELSYDEIQKAFGKPIL